MVAGGTGQYVYTHIYTDVQVSFCMHNVKVWNTAGRQGLKSGIFFWPGSEAPINGIHCMNPVVSFFYTSIALILRHVSGLL